MHLCSPRVSIGGPLSASYDWKQRIVELPISTRKSLSYEPSSTLNGINVAITSAARAPREGDDCGQRNKTRCEKLDQVVVHLEQKCIHGGVLVDREQRDCPNIRSLMLSCCLRHQIVISRFYLILVLALGQFPFKHSFDR
jgi:hypothetical protein